jgi:uncharacterized protein YbaP (TraB family)
MFVCRRVMGVIAACLVSTAQAENETVQSSELIQEVTVTGEQPGPPLWRIEKDGNTVWILGVYTLLPGKMTWRSKSVEDRISQAQRVILMPYVNVKVGLFSGLVLSYKYKKAQRIPEDASLQTIVPQDLLQRYLLLRSRYLPKDAAVDKLLPMFAAQRLYTAATKDLGLKSNMQVYSQIEHLTKKHGVPVRSTWVTPDHLSSYLDEVGAIPMAKHIKCLDAYVTLIESEASSLRARANAWAIGDMDAIRELPYAAARERCTDEILQSTQKWGAFTVQAWSNWYEAVDEALRNSHSTFTYLQLSDLLNPNGPIAKLRERGYTVHEP